MKINWGTGIIIAFALFITFIMYFVFKVQTNVKYQNELVVEDYYKHDETFGTEMEESQNAEDLSNRVSIKETENGILVIFPKNFDFQKIGGKVSLYRPSNKKLDFEIPISLSTSNLLIPKSSLVGGLWDISVAWKYNSKDFMSKQSIYIR